MPAASSGELPDDPICDPDSPDVEVQVSAVPFAKPAASDEVGGPSAPAGPVPPPVANCPHAVGATTYDLDVVDLVPTIEDPPKVSDCARRPSCHRSDHCFANTGPHILPDDMHTILWQQDEIKALEAQVHTLRLELARLKTQLTTVSLEAQNARAADQL